MEWECWWDLCVVVVVVVVVRKTSLTSTFPFLSTDQILPSPPHPTLLPLHPLKTLTTTLSLTFTTNTLPISSPQARRRPEGEGRTHVKVRRGSQKDARGERRVRE